MCSMALGRGALRRHASLLLWRSVSSSAERVSATQRWIDRLVVGEKLCPFAPPVSAPPKLRIRASSAAHADEVVAEVAEEASLLRAGIDAPAPAVGHTTLLVLDREQMGSDMLGWRDLIALSWRIQQEAIVDAGHAEHLQLVLFHPTATHTTFVEPGAPPDAGDYSIRAPYPTVQLLREVDVQAGVRSYPDAARIPARNRECIAPLGLPSPVQGLEACYKPASRWR